MPRRCPSIVATRFSASFRSVFIFPSHPPGEGVRDYRVPAATLFASAREGVLEELETDLVRREPGRGDPGPNDGDQEKGGGEELRQCPARQGNRRRAAHFGVVSTHASIKRMISSRTRR